MYSISELNKISYELVARYLIPEGITSLFGKLISEAKKINEIVWKDYPQDYSDKIDHKIGVLILKNVVNLLKTKNNDIYRSIQVVETIKSMIAKLLLQQVNVVFTDL